MSAFQAAFEALRKTVGDVEADKLLTAVENENRTDVTSEFVAWLVKRAREHRVQGPQYAKQADVIGRLADKVQRGAVRPNNLLSLPPQGGPEDVVDLRAELVRLRARVTELEAQPSPSITSTPCGPTPEVCDAEAGDPCRNHEREQAHGEGEHAFCGPECSGTGGA
ncbi:hypothetical protein [Streptomyces rubiginosohelvolus]|uniref:hypothetical protein n=1 Tax=Streptomyces rubiginosohelvolus TaxID=67362 RepID=UPI0036CE1B31